MDLPDGRSISVTPKDESGGIYIPPGQALIKGSVLLDGQSKHTGTSVQIKDTSYSTLSDSSGNYQLQVPVGDYNGLIYSKTDYTSVNLDPFTLQEKEIKEQNVITLITSLSIKGRVIINGLTDYNHPCQIMADAFTILEHLGRIENVKITYIGDGNNVANSWLNFAARIPINLVIYTPEGYEPDLKTARAAEKVGLSKIEIFTIPEKLESYEHGFNYEDIAHFMADVLYRYPLYILS